MQKKNLKTATVFLTVASLCVALFPLISRESVIQQREALADGIEISDKLDQSTLSALCGKLIDGATDLSGLRSAAEKGLGASEFHELNFSLNYGTMSWDVTYLTVNSSKQIILDLWLSKSELRDDGDKMTWNAFPPKDDTCRNFYPDSMYSTSRIRANLLGTDYLRGSGSSLTNDSNLPQSKWQTFLAQYGSNLECPENISYQAEECIRTENGDIFRYNLPNESYYADSAPIKYNYNKEGNGYTDWKSDKIWVPSLTETGANGITGIWKTTPEQRAWSGSNTWLRSAYAVDSRWVYVLSGEDAAAGMTVNSADAFLRPAVHLILDNFVDEPEPESESKMNLTMEWGIVDNIKLKNLKNNSAEYIYDGESLSNLKDFLFVQFKNEDEYTEIDYEILVDGGENKKPGESAVFSVKLFDDKYVLIENYDFIVTVIKRHISVMLTEKSFSSVYGESLKDISGCWTYSEDSLHLVGGDNAVLVTAKNLTAGADAGEYEVDVELDSEYSDYYELELKGGKGVYAIEKAVVVSPNVRKLVYNGDVQNSGIEETALYSVSDEGGKNADSYTAVLTLKNSVNYRWEFEDGITLSIKYEILPRPITVEVQNAVFTYGETMMFAYELSDEIANKDGLEVKLWTEGKIVGTYPIKGSVADTNYDATFSEAECIIKKAKVSVPKISNLIYNGEEQTIRLPHSDNYTAEIETGKNAGKYGVTLRLTDSSNYEWEGRDSSDLYLEYEILPLKLTVRIENAESVYGEPLAKLNYTVLVGEVVGTDDLGINLYRKSKSMNAGRYAIKGYSSNKNYAVTFIEGVYTIGKATVAIPKIEALTYCGSVQRAYIEKSEIYSIADNGGLKPGVYYLTLQLTYPENYQWADTEISEITLSYEIKPMPVNVKIHDVTVTYGRGIIEATEYTILENIPTGENLGITLSVQTEIYNVGRYPITGDWKNENFDVLFEEGIYEVKPYIVYEPVLGSLTFNGKLQTAELSETYYTISDEGGIDVGEYEIILTLKDRNYQWSNSEGMQITLHYTIVPLQITVKIEDARSVYGQPLAPLSYTILDEIFDDPNREIILSLDTETFETGNYLIKGTCTNKNYQVTFQSGKYTIEKATVSAPQVAPLVYSGFLQKALLSETELYTVRDLGGRTVGQHSLTLRLKDFKNYQWDNSEHADTTLHYTILPKPITVKIDNVTSSYGRALAALTYSLSEGIFVGDDLGIILRRSSDSLNAGIYSIFGTWSNENYSVTFTEGSYIIEKAAVTVTIGDAASVYGEPLAKLQYELSGEFVEGDELNIELFVNAKTLNAGIYDIEGRWSNQNYNVTFEKGKYTILKATLAVPTVLNSTYNGMVHTSGIFETDMFTVSDNGGIDAGEYVAVLRLKDTQNYQWQTEGGYEVVLKYTISPMAVRIKIENTGSVYGDPLAELKFLIKSEIVEGDDLGVTLMLDSESRNAGKYTIIGIWNNKNYAVTFENGVYLIEKAVIAVPSAENCTYDGTVHTSGIVGTEVYSVLDDGGRDAGEYTAVLRLKDFANYRWDLEESGEIFLNYTIFPLAVEVKIANVSSIYGEPLAEMRYDILGVVAEGDNLGIALTLNSENRNAGVYTIEGAWTNKNYAVIFVNGVYTIKKAELSIPTVHDFVYNGTVQTSGLYETASYFVVDDGGMNVGKYFAVLQLKDSENYTWAKFDGNTVTVGYTILPLRVKVRIESATVQYGSAFELSYTILNMIAEGDELGITLSLDSDSLNVGTYVIKGTWSNGNYEIEFESGIYTVVKAENSWTGEFVFEDWTEGELPVTPILSGSFFGDVEVKYFLDPDCTSEITHLSELKAGVYYVRVYVQGSENFEGLEKVFSFEILRANNGINDQLNQDAVDEKGSETVSVWAIILPTVAGAMVLVIIFFVVRRKAKM